MKGRVPLFQLCLSTFIPEGIRCYMYNHFPILLCQMRVASGLKKGCQALIMTHLIITKARLSRPKTIFEVPTQSSDWIFYSMYKKNFWVCWLLSPSASFFCFCSGEIQLWMYGQNLSYTCRVLGVNAIQDTQSLPSPTDHRGLWNSLISLMELRSHTLCNSLIFD